jgi:hypothetical protein
VGADWVFYVLPHPAFGWGRCSRLCWSPDRYVVAGLPIVTAPAGHGNDSSPGSEIDYRYRLCPVTLKPLAKQETENDICAPCDRIEESRN